MKLFLQCTTTNYSNSHKCCINNIVIFYIVFTITFYDLRAWVIEYEAKFISQNSVLLLFAYTLIYTISIVKRTS